MKNKRLLLLILVPALFFLASIATLKDYGINWDEPFHYFRGQAYFHYLITGKTDYKNLSARRSFFQNDSYNGAYFLKTDSAHPPANDILASAFNYIFYRKLNILGDIDSYHLFIVVTSTIAVLSVSLFAYESLGLLGGLVAGLSLALYPLFFGEGHFNIKDPVEMTFFTVTIWAFWKSLQKGDWKWLLFSSISLGLAMGTKFNIAFLPFIILPYLLICYWPILWKNKNWFKNIHLSYKVCLVLFPVIAGSLFLYLWPFLWHSPIKNFIDAISYYKSIGTGQANFPGYMFAKLNFYPIYWIFVSTPPLTIATTLIGIVSIFIGKKMKNREEILWLLWFLVPIARVTLPGSTIYGGVRQIFEYIPAMALLAGFGAKIVFDYVVPKYKTLCTIVLLLFFIPQIIVLIKLHPNENVYFNNLVGGLPGAVSKNIPYWGNSYGNAYWQAVQWMNLNSEKNAKLGLVQGTGQNIPTIQLRPDIQFSNGYWTASFRGGEYLMELTFNSGINPYPHAWEYVNKVLEPVYQVEVEGVPIAKVWKNDLAHTKLEYRKPEAQLWNYRLEKDKQSLNVTFNKQETITRFFLKYIPDQKCSGVTAQIETSLDGKKWTNELESIPNIQVSVNNLSKNTSPFFFAMRDLKFLRILTSDPNSCLLKWPSIEFWGLN